MSGLISQNWHPFFAEDLLSFQLYSLYSLISLRYLEMKTDIHSHPSDGRRPDAEVNIPAKEANEADSKAFNLRNELAQIAKKGLGAGEPAQTEKGLVERFQNSIAILPVVA